MATGFVIVPRGWERDVVEGRVFYKSPDMKTLGNREELLVHLTSDGTCKCGLRCPFQLEDQFSFDPLVLSLPDNGVPNIVQASCKVGHTYSPPGAKFDHDSITECGERGRAETARTHRRRLKQRHNRRKQHMPGGSSSVSVVTMGTQAVTALCGDGSDNSQKRQTVVPSEKKSELGNSRNSASPTTRAQDVSEMSVRGLLAQLPGSSSSPSSSSLHGKQRMTEERKLLEEKQRMSMVALRLLQAQKDPKVSDKRSPALSAVLSGRDVGEQRHMGGQEDGGSGGGGDGEFTVSIKLNEQMQSEEMMSGDVPDTLPTNSTDLAERLEHNITIIEQKYGGMKTLESDPRNQNRSTNSRLSEQSSQTSNEPSKNQSTLESVSDDSQRDRQNLMSTALPPQTQNTCTLPPSLPSTHSTLLSQQSPAAPHTTSTPSGHPVPCPPPSHTGTSHTPFKLAVHSHSSQTTPTEAASADTSCVKNSVSAGQGVEREGEGEMGDVGHLLSELCSSVGLVGGGREPFPMPGSDNSDQGRHCENIACQVGARDMYSGGDVAAENVSEWFQNETNALKTAELICEALSVVKQNVSSHLGEEGGVEHTIDNVGRGGGGGVALMSSGTHIPFPPKVSATENGHHYPSTPPTRNISSLTPPLAKLPLLSDPLTPTADTSDAVDSLLASLVPTALKINSESRACNGAAVYSEAVLTPTPSGGSGDTLSTISESCGGNDDACSHPIEELSLLTPDSHLDHSSSQLLVSPPRNLSSSVPALSRTGRTPQFGDVPIKECCIKLRPIGREWTPRKRHFSDCDAVQRERELKAVRQLNAGDVELGHVGFQPKKLKFSLLEENDKVALPAPCCNGQPVDQLLKTVQPNLEIARPDIPISTDPTTEQVSPLPSLDENTHSGLVCAPRTSDYLHLTSVTAKQSDGCVSEIEEVDTPTTATAAGTNTSSSPVETRSITQEGVCDGDMGGTGAVGDGRILCEGERTSSEGVSGSVGEMREAVEEERGEGEESAQGEGESARGEGEESARGEGEESARGEGEESARGEGEESARGEGEESAQGEGEESAPGEGEESAPGEGEESARGEGEESAQGEGEESARGEGEESVQGKFGWLHILAQVAVEASPKVNERGNFSRDQSGSSEEGLTQEAPTEQQTTPDTDGGLTCRECIDTVGDEAVGEEEGEELCVVVPRPPLLQQVSRQRSSPGNEATQRGATHTQRTGGRGRRKLRVRGRTIGQKRSMGRNAMRKISMGGMEASLVCGTEEKGEVDVMGVSDTRDNGKMETSVGEDRERVESEVGNDMEDEKPTGGEWRGEDSDLERTVSEYEKYKDLYELSAAGTHRVNGWSAMHVDKNSEQFTNESRIPLNKQCSHIPEPNTGKEPTTSEAATEAITIDTLAENNCGSSDCATKSCDTGQRSSDAGVIVAMDLEKRVRIMSRRRGGRRRGRGRGRGRGRRRGTGQQSLTSEVSEGEIHTCSSEAEVESRCDGMEPVSSGMEWEQSSSEKIVAVNETGSSESQLSTCVSEESSALPYSVASPLSAPTSPMASSRTTTMASPARPMIPTKHDSFRSQLCAASSPSSSETSSMVVSVPLSEVEVVHYRCLQCYPVSQYQAGDVVWAKAAQLPGWPGTVIDHSQWKNSQLKPAPPGKRWVKWYGDGTVSLVSEKSMKPLNEGLEKRMMRKTTKGLQRAINLALKALKKKEEQVQKL